MHHDAAPATILLVDDDAISIMAMKRALRKLNVRNETLVASDGLQALEVLRDVQVKGGGALPPFIVVLDMHMHRMNGWEFLDAVKALAGGNNLAVLVCATPEMEKHAMATREHHVQGFLSKDDPAESLSRAFANLGPATSALYGTT